MKGIFGSEVRAMYSRGVKMGGYLLLVEVSQGESIFLTVAGGESRVSHSRLATFPPGNWCKLSHLQCTELH